MTEICKQLLFPASYRFYSQFYLEYLDQSRRLLQQTENIQTSKIFVQKIKGNDHNKVSMI